MSERLKAWCHWKRKENHVSDDDMLMVRDIEALLEDNAKLRAVVVASIAMACEFETDSMSMNEIDALRGFKEALEKVVEV